MTKDKNFNGSIHTFKQVQTPVLGTEPSQAAHVYEKIRKRVAEVTDGGEP